VEEMNPLTQIRLNRMSAKPLAGILNDVLSDPLRLGIENTHIMSGIALGVIANRLEVQKDSPITIFDYGTLTSLIQECERLTYHPLIMQYTTSIFALSYFEWRNRLCRNLSKT